VLCTKLGPLPLLPSGALRTPSTDPRDARTERAHAGAYLSRKPRSASGALRSPSLDARRAHSERARARLGASF
jgi:hypothetical protein